MADTLPRKKLTGLEYQSVNNLFSITTGVAFTIQNQGHTPYKISIAATKPSLDTRSYRIAPAEFGSLVEIPAGGNTVWVLGKTIIQAE